MTTSQTSGDPILDAIHECLTNDSEGGVFTDTLIGFAKELDGSDNPLHKAIAAELRAKAVEIKTIRKIGRF